MGIPTESSQGPPLQMFSSKRPPTCVTAYFSIFCDILQISIFLINKCGFQRCVGRSWNLGIRTCYYIVGRPWHLKFIDWLLVSCLFYLFTVAMLVNTLVGWSWNLGKDWLLQGVPFNWTKSLYILWHLD